MKHTYNYSLIILPLLMLSVMGFVLLAQRQGAAYEITSQYYKENQFLPSEIVETKNYFPDRPVTTVVVYDSTTPLKGMRDLRENLTATLDSMQVKYDLLDVSSNSVIDLQKYEVVVFAVLDLSPINSQALDIIDWVRNGGRLFFAIRPDVSATSNIILGKTGAINNSDSLIISQGVEFLTDLLPGAKGLSLGKDFIFNEAYSVDLDEENCDVHVVSAESDKTPILWVCRVENGRVVVINSDQFVNKDSRGMMGAAYSLLYDTFVYPVINTSVFYIDDFPAPLPGGSNELIKKYYNNIDNSTFFRELWWEDMRKISEKYGIRYTGGMIESYEHNLVPPFPKQLDVETHSYLGRALLSTNGEIIIHGYNHVPFCKAEDNINALNGYPVWESTENEQLALIEVYNFGQTLFKDYRFLGYIPPSNILCPEARRWMPTVIPDIKYIASVYLPDIDGQEYLQEFTEAPDGVIEFPRIVAGYDMMDDEYARWAVINELSLHYLNSQFVHPDDMLDLDRHAEKGWGNLRDQYIGFIEWLQNTAPGLRSMTGSEGAMAVQRFSRLAVDTNLQDGKLEISLGNFYDEAWLMIRSVYPPLSIDGGVITQVSTNEYLVQALNPNITILFEE